LEYYYISNDVSSVCTIQDLIKETYVIQLLTGEWTKLHNEELSDLYSLPNIVRVVKIEKN